MSSKLKGNADAILDALRADSQVKRVNLCKFGRWLAEQSAEIQEALEAAKTDETITATAIHRYATACGYEGRDTSVVEHRRDHCACAKHANEQGTA